MDDKQEYLRWLEEMWNVQKFDLQGSTERGEERRGRKRSSRCSGSWSASRSAAWRPRIFRPASSLQGRIEFNPCIGEELGRLVSRGVSPEARTFRAHQ